MEAFTRRIEEETGSAVGVSDSGFLSADDLRSDSSEASTSRDQQDETSPASISESVISTQKLPLYEGPEIIQRLNVFEEVELGSVIVFECHCKGNPVPTCKWYKDDVELVNADRVTIEDSVEANGKIRLTIQNARKSDEGAYRCKLENQEGVAASTGYLSVTGSSASPKSEHSVSSPPLLRAITEESNASQDLDETLSTPLDKILTGEYDLTTLPYSQYLELMRENKATNAQKTVSGLSNEDDERSRTSQQKNAENGDVTNEEADLRTDAVVMETSATPRQTIDAQTRFSAENDDFEMSFSTDSTNSFDAETPTVRVSTYGLGGFHPVQVIREDFGGDGSSGFLEKKGDESDRPTLQEYSNIEDGDGDFGKETVIINSPDDGKLSLAETVIAGRIGLPSDWEFAHYTQESEDSEVLFNDLPYETGNQVAEAVSENIETTPAQIEILPDHTETPSQEMVREGLVPVRGSPLLNEESPGSGVVLVERSVISDSSGGSGMSSERVEKIAELLESELLQNPSNAIREPDSVSPQGAGLLPEPDLSTRIGNKSDSSKIAEKVDLDLKAGFLEPLKVESAAEDTTPETPLVASREDGKITTANEREYASKEITSQLPGEEAVKRPLEVAAAPETEGDLAAASFPADEEVSVTEVGAFPLVRSTISGLEKSGETLPPTTEKTAAAEDFQTFNTGSPPEIPSTFAPLPDLASQVQWEEIPPVRVEDVEVSVMSDQSLVEWLIEWFQFPWFFYVILVLLATVVASAMQLNPALVILVVSTLSLAGFFLFPLQGVKSNKKQQ